MGSVYVGVLYNVYRRIASISELKKKKHFILTATVYERGLHGSFIITHMAALLYSYLTLFSIVSLPIEGESIT